MCISLFVNNLWRYQLLWDFCILHRLAWNIKNVNTVYIPIYTVGIKVWILRITDNKSFTETIMYQPVDKFAWKYVVLLVSGRIIRRLLGVKICVFGSILVQFCIVCKQCLKPLLWQTKSGRLPPKTREILPHHLSQNLWIYILWHIVATLLLIKIKKCQSTFGCFFI